MSSVHGKAGDCGWVQSFSCDFCPAKVSRKGTGKIERTPLSITDPRRRLDSIMIEYEEQRFDPGALDGWGNMTRWLRSTNLLMLEDRSQIFDMCPTCFQVMLDQALERARQEPTCEEVDFGKEVPAPAPLIGTTLGILGPPIGASREEIEARAAQLGYDPMIPVPDPHPRGRGRVGPCHYGPGSGGARCPDQSMPGQWYCFRHAAGGR